MFGTDHSTSTVWVYIRVYPYIVCIVYAFIYYARWGKSVVSCIALHSLLKENATMQTMQGEYMHNLSAY